MIKTPNLDRLKQGDQYAWEELVEQTSPKLLNLFRSMLGVPVEEARELVSDVYVKAFKGIQGFREEAKLTTWINTIASNVARDYVRKASREAVHIDIHENDIAGEPKDDNFDEEINVVELLGELPEAYQKVLYLHYIEQNKYEKIAEFLNIPLGTIKTLIFRGKKMMREVYMKKYGAGLV